MGIEDLTELYAYNGWANERVRNSIQDLDPEVFKRDLGASFGSLQGTVAHLVSAQWNWLRRWKGQSVSRPLPSEAFESPAEANRRWEEVDRALAGFVDGLDAAGLQQSIALTTPQGSSYSSRLWRAMLHVDHVGLPNLLAGRRLVPELLQDDATPERLGPLVLDRLDHPDRQRAVLEEFDRIHRTLRNDAFMKASEAVLEVAAA